jgi:uncharacterized protein YndB with AHSA1/START domain
MAIIQETIDIKYPVDKVFAYVADAKSWPKWHASMMEANQTSSGQMGIGTTFGGVNKVVGRRMPWTSTVSEYVANTEWSETISSGSTIIKEKITCDPIEGGTKFTEVYDMKVGGFLKLLSPMVISTMQKEMKSNLKSLKSILEAKA